MPNERATRARYDDDPDPEGGYIVPLPGELDRDGNEFNTDDTGRLPRNEYHELSSKN